MKHQLDTSSLTDEELIQAFGVLLTEMRTRRIIRTKNIVGELGEKYCQMNCNIKLSPTNEKDIDATDSLGRGYTIKSATETSAKRTGAFHLDFNHSKDDVRFHFLLVVIISDSMELKNIYSFTWDDFWLLKSWSKPQKAYFLSLSKKNLLKGELLV